MSAGDFELLTSRHADFHDSALRMRVFVSEVFGLGMLTAVASQMFGWQRRSGTLAGLDRLPTELTGFRGGGVRPDLLFD